LALLVVDSPFVALSALRSLDDVFPGVPESNSRWEALEKVVSSLRPLVLACGQLRDPQVSESTERIDLFSDL
jgi:hypothetical protein